VDIKDPLIDLLNHWTPKDYLDRPIYRYMSFEEFASILEIKLARFNRIDLFGDPWDSAVYNEALVKKFSELVQKYGQYSYGFDLSPKPINWNSNDNKIDGKEYFSVGKIEEEFQLPKKYSGKVVDSNKSFMKSTDLTNQLIKVTPKTGSETFFNTFEDILALIRSENYAWCWTLNHPKNMTMWLTYANRSTSVCVQSTPRKIIRNLSADFQFICGKIDYQKLKLDNPEFIPFSKLQSYEFEHEFRFVFRKNNSKRDNPPKQDLTFYLPRNTRIYIHPHANLGLFKYIEKNLETHKNSYKLCKVIPNLNDKP